MQEYKIEKVKLTNGHVCSIPVGKDGYVPVDALIRRFNSVVEKGHIRNKSKDYDQEASVVLPTKLTPREAAVWWDAPNRYDIEYIDTPGKAQKNIGYIKDPESKKIHEKLDIICLPSEEREIRKIIDEAYPLEERQKLVKNGNVTVVVRPLQDSAGNIVGRKIELDRDHGKNNSTFVHEGAHLLRKNDGSRNGVAKTVMAVSDLSKVSEINSLNLEESCTVAEQMARGKNPSSGYYQFVQVFDEKKKKWRYPTEKEASDMMKEDRAMFTNGTNKPLKGNAAVKSVNENWSQSNISRLKIEGSKTRAIDEFSKRKDKMNEIKPPKGILGFRRRSS